MKKKNKELYEVALWAYKHTMAELHRNEAKYFDDLKAIERYTSLGVLREKIKYVSGVLVCDYENVRYSALSYDKLDVREINESDGIIICSATYGEPIWRYAYVSAKDHATEQAIVSYTRYGVKREKILFVSDIPCFKYLNEVYVAKPHTDLNIDEINNSDGIVICSNLSWQGGDWRYAYVKKQQKVFPMGPPLGQLLYVDFKYDDVKPKPKCDECSNYNPSKETKDSSNDWKYLRIIESVFGGFTICEIGKDGQQIGWAGSIRTIPDVEEFVKRNFPEYELVTQTIRLQAYWSIVLQRKSKEPESKCDNCMNFEEKPKKDPWIIGSYEFVQIEPGRDLYKLIQHTEDDVIVISRKNATFNETYITFLAECSNFCGQMYEINKIDGKTYYKPSKFPPKF